jgi:type IV secretory pathway TrbL component
VRIRRLLVHAAPLVALALLVIVVHLLIVLGIGNVPTAGQAALLAASAAAAAATALFYLPLRRATCCVPSAAG